MAVGQEFGAGMRRAWYLVARSSELGAAPLGARLLGHPIVLFRAADGAPAALEDRCPHKNTELSLGRVERGVLRCPYHGWGFDGSGACVDVPSAAPGDPRPRHGARRFPVHEADGSIWVHLGEAPAAAPPAWPAARGVRFELHTRVRAPLVRVLENFVDTSHTGFVHAGLFRGAPERLVRAALSETDGGVRIETSGETDPGSLLARLLVPAGEAIEHVDELIVPHTIRVAYRFGTRRIVTVSICTPEDTACTRIFTRVWVEAPPLSGVVAIALRAVTRRILGQDKRVLESQARVLESFGGARFQSVVADRPTDWVARSLARFERGLDAPEEPRSCEVLYRL
jgi:phenylpropionate dioxygenase-like ring-hydroxylating dioxygenase large terminal subunit